jgi:hypothetical protein
MFIQEKILFKVTGLSLFQALFPSGEETLSSDILPVFLKSVNHPAIKSIKGNKTLFSRGLN